eukprot:3713762-Pyramimonas_sp.AAC.1
MPSTSHNSPAVPFGNSKHVSLTGSLSNVATSKLSPWRKAEYVGATQFPPTLCREDVNHSPSPSGTRRRRRLAL